MQDKIVSSECEELILVDARDNEVGYRSKSACHDGDGLLHRAFSVFIFNPAGELLLQQRGKNKRLWPGYWSNSCCSHPRKGESMETATHRRVSEELGVEVDLEYAYKFRYQVSFGQEGAEHELCSVFLGRCDTGVQPNPTEIENIRFVRGEQLSSEMRATPSLFTPWFQQEWNTLEREYTELLGRYR